MKTLYALCLTLSLIVFSSHSCVAQANAQIAGKIIDEKKQGIEFTTIHLLKAADSSVVKTTVSSNSGTFQFKNIANGAYLLKISSVSFQKYTSSKFSVDSSAITIPDIVLLPESRSLQTVTITAQKPFIERKAGKLVVNVEGSAVATGSTALEVLQKAPGISVDKDDNISMNGKSSVLIMLDGKPTYMSNADVANMLRSMQSNQIESIELITNPSAKYDAAGNAGIINIRTKKDKRMGFNGSLSAGTGYGRTSKYNTGLNANLRKGKVNLFGNYNFSDNGNKSTFNLHRIVDSAGTITQFNQDNGWNNRRNNNSYKAGMDFYLTKKTTLGALVTGYRNSVDELTNSGTVLLDVQSNPGNSINVKGRNVQKYSNKAFNFNLKTTFDTLGKELSFDADFSDYSGKLDEFRDNFYSKPDGQTQRPAKYIHNLAPADIQVWAAKIDYTHPINKTLKLETGLKSSWVTTDNNLKFDTLFTDAQNNQKWVSDAARTNHFIYKENINAGYINFNKQFKTLSIQAGLRAEHTNSNGNSITTDSVIKRNYIRFFPSASISQKLGKSHQLGLTYSRRIDRPNYDNLNPFVFLLDDYTYMKGNPYLNPQFTNSAELSYTLKSSYTLSLSYSKTNNAMATITEQDDNTKVTYAQERNLSSQTVYSANLYAPVPVRKWWKMNNNIQVFNMGFKSNLSGSTLDVNQTVFQINTDNQITINKTTGAEISFWYMSKLKYALFEIKNSPALNLGFRKSFYDNKMSLKMNLNDVLNTMKNRGATNFANMNLNFSNKWESRVANISLTYRFGSNNIRPERQRKTSLDSESNRMKN